MNNTELDRVFAALSDSTRRGMLARLASGGSNVKTLSADYDISQPAVSKHLKVLESAGLITRTRVGRESLIQVDPRRIEEASTWIGKYSRFWRLQFDAVDDYLKANVAKERSS